MPEADPQPQTLYDAVGGEPAFRRLIGRFYEEVATDAILRPMYPEEDLGPAEERLRLFLIQFCGGPRTYAERRGPGGGLGMHRRFEITVDERDAWLRAMRVALDAAAIDEPYRAQLWSQFELTATRLINTPRRRRPKVVPAPDAS